MTLNIEEFLSHDKAMLIAPAGYGKTHTISQCIKFCEKEKLGKQLILTHTHAGVSSIKEKLKKEGVKSDSYTVETISSYAQKYVLSYYRGADLPPQENGNLYHPFLIEKATKFFKTKPIKTIIQSNYSGLFVDEYQDCSIKQHQLILSLSEVLKTRILGDPMQGIFNFNGQTLVNLNDSSEMGDFCSSKYELDIPNRWRNQDTNEISKLGNSIKEIRRKLENSEVINLPTTGIEFYGFEAIDSKGVPCQGENYGIIKDILTSGSNILVIEPISERLNPRLYFIQGFYRYGVRLLESIDEKDYYKYAKQFDTLNSSNFEKKIIEFLFDRLIGFRNYYDKKNKRFIKKKDSHIKDSTEQIISIFENIKAIFSKRYLSLLLLKILNLPEIKCYRLDLYKTLVKSLIESESDGISIYEAMVNSRNRFRRFGRKIYGKNIGTTLLTKGLECDTVLILGANKFTSKEHFYVAISRATKRLIILSDTNEIKFS